MSLDWPALQELIDAGDASGVVAATAGLDDRQRRSLVTPLKAYATQWRAELPLNWEGTYDIYRAVHVGRAQALRVAGAGCLVGTDEVARWLTRMDLWAGDLRPGQTLQVLRARPRPWLAEVARRMADRLRRDDWHLHLLVVELVTDTGVVPPSTEAFAAAWMEAVGERGPTLADAVRDDPLRDTLVPMLFDVDGLGRRLETFDSSQPARSWALALAALAGEGVLNRAMLIDRCVARLLHGGRPAELRGYLQVYQALGVTVDEAGARTQDLVRLLPDAPSTVAGLAQAELRRAHAAGQFDLDTLLQASRYVLHRDEKKLITAQLSWLDAAAVHDRDRTGDIVSTATIAFEQAAADLQLKAVTLVGKHLRHVDDTVRVEIATAATTLPADLRAQLADALGVALPAPRPAVSAPILAPPPPRRMPPPIADPAELAEDVAALLHASERLDIDPLSLERVLSGVVALAHTDRDGLRVALQPVLARHLTPPEWRESPHIALQALLAAAVADIDPTGQTPTNPVRGDPPPCRCCCTASTRSP